MAFAVVDLDGVLADTRHRMGALSGRRKDWDAFFAGIPDDPVHPEGRGVVEEVTGRGLSVVYLTGRPERTREATLDWLRRNGFPDGPLLMRRDDDRRAAADVKLAHLLRLAKVEPVEVLVDDDPAVVKAVRAAWNSPVRGVLLARWQPRDRATNAAQHRHGRT